MGARRLVDFAREAEVHDQRLWTPIADASEYGRELIPLVRAEVARRDHPHAAA